VTFHATWSEVLPLADARAVEAGDVLQAPDWTWPYDRLQEPGLPVTRVEERGLELHVYVSDRERERLRQEHEAKTELAKRRRWHR